MKNIEDINRESAQKIASKRKLPEFFPGDTIRVGVRIVEGKRARIQNFEGVCIAKKNRDINSSFTVRKISFGEGVERTFALYSPIVGSIKVVRSGKVKREFLFVDDLADAIDFLLRKKTKHNLINVGSGEEVTIKNLSKLIASVTGYKGKIIFNRNYPDGTPRKIVDTSILSKMGWRHKTKLRDGLIKVYQSYVN